MLPVHVPTSSDVSEVRSFAREAGRRSFHFFMTTILEVAAREDVCEAFQDGKWYDAFAMVRRYEFRRYFEAYLLWWSIQEKGASTVQTNEAVRWLYPDVLRRIA